MPNPVDDALPYARARLAVLRHVRDELHRTSLGAIRCADDDRPVLEIAVGVYLLEIDEEIKSTRRIIGALA